MYEKVEKPKENKSRAVANTITQNKSNGKQSFVDNRTEIAVQRKLQVISNSSAGIIQTHSKQCGCPCCTSTMQQPLQKKNKTSGEKILQLMCEECGKKKGHLSNCSRNKHNRSNTGKGTHKLGGSHDDGSGYQHSGSGGDRHEKGRRAAQKAKERKTKKKKGKA